MDLPWKWRALAAEGKACDKKTGSTKSATFKFNIFTEPNGMLKVAGVVVVIC